jgi:hypothetical protein
VVVPAGRIHLRATRGTREGEGERGGERERKKKKITKKEREIMSVWVGSVWDERAVFINRILLTF